MVVKIIPLKRLPRPLSLFDYEAPQELASTLQPGQLVTIPYRNAEHFGVVYELTDTQEKKGDLKSITRIVHQTPLLSPTHLSLLPLIADWYGVSWSTLAMMVTPPLQKRKLATMELIPFETLSPNTPEKTMYHHYQNEREHGEALQSAIGGTTIILVPEVHRLREVYELLTDEQKKETVQWYSDLSTKDKYSRWMTIRNKEKSIILGTRGAVFAPCSTLDSIIIDYEHDEDHKHWDQAPRFAVHDIADVYRKTYGAALRLMSFSQKVESYFHVHKQHYQLISRSADQQNSSSAAQLISRTNSPIPQSTNQPIITNMADERRGRNFSCLGTIPEEKLLEATGDVFLFINRLGFATSVGCNDCEHVETCPNCLLPFVYHEKRKLLACHYCKTTLPMPLVCSKCTNAVVQLRGIGTESVEHLVRTLFTNKHTHDIIRYDSNHEPALEENGKPRIIIGTEKAFRSIRWKQTELVVFLDIDKQIHIPEYAAEEHVWHLIHEVKYHLPSSSSFFIQTFNPHQLVIRSLTEPERFYRTSLNFRKSLHYPPYIYLTRYFYGHVDQNTAKREADKLYVLFEKLMPSILEKYAKQLTTTRFSDMVSSPMEMHPRYYRGKFWYTLLVRFPHEVASEILPWLNTKLPPSWKIDPNPNSILSP